MFDFTSSQRKFGLNFADYMLWKMAYFSGAVFLGLSCMEDWEVSKHCDLGFNKMYLGDDECSLFFSCQSSVFSKRVGFCLQDCILDKKTGKIEVKRQSLIQKVFQASKGQKLGELSNRCGVICDVILNSA